MGRGGRGWGQIGDLERQAKGGEGAPFKYYASVFHVKQGNIKFLHVNNILYFSLFIEQDISGYSSF